MSKDIWGKSQTHSVKNSKMHVIIILKYSKHESSGGGGGAFSAEKWLYKNLFTYHYLCTIWVWLRSNLLHLGKQIHFYLLILFHMQCQQGLGWMNCGCRVYQTLISLQSVKYLLIFKTSSLQEMTLRPCIVLAGLPTEHNSVCSNIFTGKDLHDHKDSVWLSEL